MLRAIPYCYFRGLDVAVSDNMACVPSFTERLTAAMKLAAHCLTRELTTGQATGCPKSLKRLPTVVRRAGCHEASVAVGGQSTTSGGGGGRGGPEGAGAGGGGGGGSFPTHKVRKSAPRPIT